MSADAARWSERLTAAGSDTILPAAACTLDAVERCAVSPVMIGRADQLAALDEAFAASTAGEPAAVLVGGEIGIGKSRLVEEFAGRVATRGSTVLSGGCLELGASGLPFAPFTAVLRELVRELGAGGVSELLAGQPTKELARLLPELGQHESAEE